MVENGRAEEHHHRVPKPADLPSALTWSRLHAFCLVLEEGSITAAADLLMVSPPAVSASISVLEQELGTKLFTRAGRGIVPTEAGRVFGGYARALLGLVDEAQAAVRDADRGRLRVGIVTTAAETLLPRLIASFTRAHPRVELVLSVAPRDELFAALGHHELDVVLAGRPPQGSGFVSRATRANSLVVVGAGRDVTGAHPDGDGAADAPIAAGQSSTNGTTWLLRERGSGTRQTAEALLAGFDPAPPTLTLGTQGACVAGAREGLGVTLVHSDAVARDLAAGDLIVLDVPGSPLDRPWHLCTGATASRAAELFIRHVTDPALVGDAVLTRTLHHGSRPGVGGQRGGHSDPAP
ncbi:LysR family transcriptional regulator [Granulicoccus sp. GXG6511]|uniref:LysR family transcriptional regulator n=1 Tax=Granulicoccus sp. GXG6511 TaxID=3381351 RepID=UPI003D7EBC0D